MTSTNPHPKRPRDSLGTTGGQTKRALVKLPQDVADNPFHDTFMGFREDLDEHHDRRERVIKASRDITALSKKMIFTLQRVRTPGRPLPPNLEKDYTTRLSQIHEIFAALSPDLQFLNAYRYQRQISGGIQEYIEAISFHHYLQTRQIISHAAAQASIPGNIELTQADYILGLFDFVGEVMRIGITMIATGGMKNMRDVKEGGSFNSEDILQDLRELRLAFEALGSAGGGLAKEVEKKMGVMRTCVEKVETAVYGLIVRGSERQAGWVMDMPIMPIDVRGGGRDDGEQRARGRGGDMDAYEE
ncbi:hypothetical protein RUND412_002325 [Rhizina undulata]